MKSFYQLAVATVVASASSQFPAFDDKHAHCSMRIHSGKPCSDIFKTITNVVDNNKDTASPPGTYRPKSRSTKDNYVWAVRQTADLKYYDDVMFVMENRPNDSCTVEAVSRSQSPSYIDFNVNFCNMYNVLKQADPKVNNNPKMWTTSYCTHNQTDYTACGRY